MRRTKSYLVLRYERHILAREYFGYLREELLLHKFLYILSSKQNHLSILWSSWLLNILFIKFYETLEITKLIFILYPKYTQKKSPSGTSIF